MLYTNTEDADKHQEAEGYLLQSLAIRRDLVKDNPQVHLPELAKKYPHVYQPQVATSQMTLGGLYCMTRQYEQAEEYYKLALKNFEQAVEENSSTFMQPLAQTLAALGLLYTETNRPAQAKKYYEKALMLFSALEEKQPGLFLSDIEDLKAELEGVGSKWQ